MAKDAGVWYIKSETLTDKSMVFDVVNSGDGYAIPCVDKAHAERLLDAIVENAS